VNMLFIKIGKFFFLVVKGDLRETVGLSSFSLTSGRRPDGICSVFCFMRHLVERNGKNMS